MRRCNNCGWTNADELSSCDKCNSPLTSIASSSPPTVPIATPSGSSPASPNAGNPNVAATKMGKRAAAPAWDNNLTPPQAPPISSNPQQDAVPKRKHTDPMPDRADRKANNSIICPNPNCGYPNPINYTECVKCETPLHEPAETVVSPKGFDGTGDSPKKESKKAADPRQIDRNAAVDKSRKVPENSGATMNPWSKPKYARFHLLPVSREGEDLNIRLDFEGNTVDLNRANLEPTNMTITSKVQAVVSYRDGQWYLANESEMQTTFIRVDGEIRLQKGDILLMGDRMFEFDC